MHGRMRGLVSRGFTPRPRRSSSSPASASSPGSTSTRRLSQGQLRLHRRPRRQAPDGRHLRADRRARGRPRRGAAPVRPARAPRGGHGRRAPRPAWRPPSPSSPTTPTCSPSAEPQRTDDLTSALLDAEVDGDRLTDDEIMGFLFLMVVAGNETTTKLLGNAWYWAWRNPDERAKPFADPARIPAWIEETLRYDTSTQMLARRHHRAHRAARHGDPGGRAGGAAGRLRQPRRARVRRRRPLRPRPSRRARCSRSPASASVATSASAPRWPASRRGCASRSWWRASPTTTSTLDAARRVHSVNVRGFASSRHGAPMPHHVCGVATPCG